MRIDRVVFGYKTLFFDETALPKVATALLKCGLSAEFEGCSFSVRADRLKRYTAALSGISYATSEMKGLPGVILKNKSRYGLFVGLVLLAALFLFSSSVVWDVRVEGNERMSEDMLCEQLASLGLSVGSRWNSIELSEIEASALLSVDGLAWINVNREGTVAYVKIREKSPNSSEQVSESFGSNIVASADCVIEEITVLSGVAKVVPGQSVKKGDLLISGALPEEVGGGYTRAEGSVVGSINKRVEVLVNREEEVREYSQEILVKKTIKIFGFSLNIFKRYGNPRNSYVIIEDNKKISLFGEYRLPIEISSVYRREYSTKTLSRADEELVKIAEVRLSSCRAELLREAELLAIRTGGGFTESGYSLCSDMRVLASVGTEKKFTD